MPSHTSAPVLSLLFQVLYRKNPNKVKCIKKENAHFSCGVDNSQKRQLPCYDGAARVANCCSCSAEPVEVVGERGG